MKKTTLWWLTCIVVMIVSYLLSLDIEVFALQPIFWGFRQQLVFFSGYVCLMLMTLAMVIAVRPAWLDKATGGLDKAYWIHKWAGIWLIVALTIHYFAENIPTWLVKSGIMQHPGFLGHGAEPVGWFKAAIEYSVVAGEYAFYVFLILAIIALVHKIPYHWFKWLHKVFPVIYLVAAWHSIMMLFKANWWGNIAGWFTILLVIIGTIAAVVSLSQRIAKSRQYMTTVTKLIKHNNNSIELTIKMRDQGFTHQAGQFVFVTFEQGGEAHPFTIASASNEQQQLTFVIKALGDYTTALIDTLYEGQSIQIEGPYGQFQFTDSSQQQIWVAGGIGITPFLAQLQLLASNGGTTKPIHFWYCGVDLENNTFPEKLEELCKQAKVTLYKVDSQHKEHLTVDKIKETVISLASTSVWFCGPSNFASSLQQGLRKYGLANNAFHNELFNMR